MDDLISRAEAIRWVKTECNPYGKPTLEFESGKKVIEHLEQMPSAQPERKHGKWIKHAKGFWTFVNANGERDGWLPDYECSECGSRGHDMICVYNFCPMCGAEMEMESEWT